MCSGALFASNCLSIDSFLYNVAGYWEMVPVSIWPAVYLNWDTNAAVFPSAWGQPGSNVTSQYFNEIK